VVGGTQVIREDTKRHRCRRCRAGECAARGPGTKRHRCGRCRAGWARSATGVGAAALAGLRCARPGLLSDRTCWPPDCRAVAPSVRSGPTAPLGPPPHQAHRTTRPAARSGPATPPDPPPPPDLTHCQTCCAARPTASPDRPRHRTCCRLLRCRPTDCQTCCPVGLVAPSPPLHQTHCPVRPVARWIAAEWLGCAGGGCERLPPAPGIQRMGQFGCAGGLGIKLWTTPLPVDNWGLARLSKPFVSVLPRSVGTGGRRPSSLPRAVASSVG
jgi:hypothetical protein